MRWTKLKFPSLTGLEVTPRGRRRSTAPGSPPLTVGMGRGWSGRGGNLPPTLSARCPELETADQRRGPCTECCLGFTPWKSQKHYDHPKSALNRKGHMPNHPASTWGGNKGLIYMELTHGLNNSVLPLQKRVSHHRNTLTRDALCWPQKPGNRVSLKKPVVAWGGNGREWEEQALMPDWAVSAHAG